MNLQHQHERNVRHVLYEIKERGGRIDQAFIVKMLDELRGQYPYLIVNICLMALGQKQLYPTQSCYVNERELGWLVQKAQEKWAADLVHEVKKLRAARREAAAQKNAETTAEQQPERPTKLEEMNRRISADFDDGIVAVLNPSAVQAGYTCEVCRCSLFRSEELHYQRVLFDEEQCRVVGTLYYCGTPCLHTYYIDQMVAK